jgi:hypothetical protein
VVFTAYDAGADVIWIEGQHDPLYGVILSRDETGVVLRTGFDNDTPIRKIATHQIKLVVVNLDHRRLEALNPQKLGEYRDYAEELAVQKKDPTARELAIRLYLIAATNGANAIRDSALTGLVGVARDPREESTFRLLRHLHSELADGGENQPVERAGNRSGATTSGEKLLRAIQMMRRGKNIEAGEFLADETVSIALGEFPVRISWQELREIASVTRPTMAQLDQLLRIEAELRFGSLVGFEQEGVESRHWSASAHKPAKRFDRLPTFANATEFDPYLSVYREGKWVSEIPTSIKE